jgi:hypothetical protein
MPLASWDRQWIEIIESILPRCHPIIGRNGNNDYFSSEHQQRPTGLASNFRPDISRQTRLPQLFRNVSFGRAPKLATPGAEINGNRNQPVLKIPPPLKHATSAVWVAVFSGGITVDAADKRILPCSMKVPEEEIRMS